MKRTIPLVAFFLPTVLAACLSAQAATKRLTGAVSAAESRDGNAPAAVREIKAYCLDFNWEATSRRYKPFAKPGTWAGADPAEHVAWYRSIGANVIQTFCVSNNGYAMYKEADWLLNERGDQKSIDAVKRMVGKQTRLITCLADWNGQDATQAVPAAVKAGIGLYGFTTPRNAGGLVPLEKILSRPVAELKDDDRNIAALARAYHGVSIDTVWDDKKGEFVEPKK